MDRESRVAFPRALRQSQTPAEARLWQALRGGRLDGLKFRRQHRIEPYVADFACEPLRLILELDGGVHEDDEQALKDLYRQQDLERLGWSVLRFPNADVMGDLPGVLEAIRQHVKLARA